MRIICLFILHAPLPYADETVGYLRWEPFGPLPFRANLGLGSSNTPGAPTRPAPTKVIVVGDKTGAGRLFTQADPYYLVCLDAKSGKELWRKSYSMLDLLPDGGRKTHDDALLQSTKNYDAGKDYRGKELSDLGKVGIKIDGRTDWMGCYTFTRATPASLM